ARRPRRRRRKIEKATNNAHRTADPTVFVGRRPGSNCNAPTLPKNAERALEASERVRHEHDAPSDRHRIKRLRRKIELFTIHLHELDIAQSLRCCLFAGECKHVSGEIDSSHLSRGPDPLRYRYGGLTCTRSDVEHSLSGAYVRELDHADPDGRCRA